MIVDPVCGKRINRGKARIIEQQGFAYALRFPSEPDIARRQKELAINSDARLTWIRRSPWFARARA